MSETFKTNLDSKPHKETNYNIFSGVNIPKDFFKIIEEGTTEAGILNYLLI